MIFQNDDDLYRPRHAPWGTILVSAFCFVLALAVVLGIRNRVKRTTAPDDGPPPSVIPPVAGTETVPATPQPASVAPQAAPATPQPPAPKATPQPAPQPAPPPTPPPTPVASQPAKPQPSLPATGLAAERTALLSQLASAPDDRRAAIEQRLGAVNVALFISTIPAPGKVEHAVVSGDSLAGLASRYECPRLLIRQMNALKGDSIRAGTRLMVLDHPKVAIRISTRSNTLLLTLNGEFFKRYPVCTGANGKTPHGTFHITEREENPTWYPDGRKPIPPGQPGNILGTRWLRLDATGDTARVRGIGIHGTTDPASIGTSASDGCIRMLNADVEELFRMITLNPRVPVTIGD